MRLFRKSAAAMTLAGAGVIAVSCGTPITARRGPALPFIEDDYPRAVAEARAKKLPIFVESWAPW